MVIWHNINVSKIKIIEPKPHASIQLEAEATQLLPTNKRLVAFQRRTALGQFFKTSDDAMAKSMWDTPSSASIPLYSWESVSIRE